MAKDIEIRFIVDDSRIDSALNKLNRATGKRIPIEFNVKSPQGLLDPVRKELKALTNDFKQVAKEINSLPDTLKSDKFVRDLSSIRSEFLKNKSVIQQNNNELRELDKLIKSINTTLSRSPAGTHGNLENLRNFLLAGRVATSGVSEQAIIKNIGALEAQRSKGSFQATLDQIKTGRIGSPRNKSSVEDVLTEYGKQKYALYEELRGIESNLDRFNKASAKTRRQNVGAITNLESRKQTIEKQINDLYTNKEKIISEITLSEKDFQNAKIFNDLQAKKAKQDQINTLRGKVDEKLLLAGTTSATPNKGILQQQYNILERRRKSTASDLEAAILANNPEEAERLSSILASQTGKVRSKGRELDTFDLRRKEAREKALFTSNRQELEGIATRFRIPVEELQSGGLFNLRRLQASETLAQLGFATVFGGPGAALGAAIGGSTKFGGGGAILGSTAAEALSRALDPVFSKFNPETIKQAGEAFQRSILGLTAIRQANNQVFLGGKPVDITAQPALAEDVLRFQSRRSEALQQRARKLLLPLGIGGQTEATFVQGVASALSQRGIEASPEQTARIAELFGGAITSQRPSLLENTQQLLKDLQDVIGGGPAASRTILSQLVKPALPGLQRATSGEDIVRALKPLEAFVTVAKNLDNPTVSINKFNSAIDNLNTIAGDKLLKGITPAIKRLSDVLSSDKTVAAAEKIGEALGVLTSNSIDAVNTFVSFSTFMVNNVIDPINKALPVLTAFAATIATINAAAAAFGGVRGIIPGGGAGKLGKGIAGFLGKDISGVFKAGATGGAASFVRDSGLRGGLRALLGLEGLAAGGGGLLARAVPLATSPAGIAALLATVASISYNNFQEGRQKQIQDAQQRQVEALRGFSEKVSPLGQLNAALNQGGLKDEFDTFSKESGFNPLQKQISLNRLRSLAFTSAGSPTLRSFIGNKNFEELLARQERQFNTFADQSSLGAVRFKQSQSGERLSSLQARLLQTRTDRENIQDESQRAFPGTIASQRKEINRRIREKQDELINIQGELNNPFVTAFSTPREVLKANKAIALKEREELLKQRSDLSTKILEDSKEVVNLKSQERDIEQQILKEKQNQLELAKQELSAIQEVASLTAQTFNRESPLGSFLGSLSDLAGLKKEETALQNIISKGGGERAILQLEANRVKQQQTVVAVIRAQAENTFRNPFEGANGRTIQAQFAEKETGAKRAAFITSEIDKQIRELEKNPNFSATGPLNPELAQRLDFLNTERNKATRVTSEFKADVNDNIVKEFQARESLITSLERYSDVQFELTQKSRDLVRQQDEAIIAFKKAGIAIDDFEQSTKLRSLGATGQRLAAAKKYLAAGGSETDLPAEIRGFFGPGGESFQQDFEKSLAKEELDKVFRETDPFRQLQEDEFTRRGLQISKERAGEQLTSLDRQRNILLPRERRNADLALAQSITSIGQNVDENSPLGQLLKNKLPQFLRFIDSSFRDLNNLADKVPGFGGIKGTKGIGINDQDNNEIKEGDYSVIPYKPTEGPLQKLVKDQEKRAKEETKGRKGFYYDNFGNKVTTSESSVVGGDGLILSNDEDDPFKTTTPDGLVDPDKFFTKKEDFFSQGGGIDVPSTVTVPTTIGKKEDVNIGNLITTMKEVNDNLRIIKDKIPDTSDVLRSVKGGMEQSFGSG